MNKKSLSSSISIISLECLNYKSFNWLFHAGYETIHAIESFVYTLKAIFVFPFPFDLILLLRSTPVSLVSQSLKSTGNRQGRTPAHKCSNPMCRIY